MSESTTECRAHGEAIVRILALSEGMHEHLQRLNGRMGKAEERLHRVETQQAAFQFASAENTRHRQALEEWQQEQEKSMKSVWKFIDEWRGRNAGKLAIAERLLTIAALAVSAWAAYSGHVQAVAAAAQK